jgi:NADH:ubiquinone oxidoreductase subunit K
VVQKSRSSRGIGLSGFLVRLIGALALVLITYNPSGHSAWHWVSDAISQSAFGPVELILIAVLLIGWAVYWIASWRALGVLGVVLIAVLLGALVWLLVDIGWISTESDSAITWIMLVTIAFMLAIGVSWSHIWRRMTGQINVEDVND